MWLILRVQGEIEAQEIIQSTLKTAQELLDARLASVSAVKAHKAEELERENALRREAEALIKRGEDEE